MSPAAPGFNAEAMGGDRIRLVAGPRDGDGDDVLLTELDGRFWTAEVTASFTGRVVGLFATQGTVTFTGFHAEGSDAPADV
jgi:xylan 1,4-beta-xylosidase